LDYSNIQSIGPAKNDGLIEYMLKPVSTGS
jgi:hypothetical protein